MFFAGVSTGAGEPSDSLTQLAVCAQIADTPERVACYETLGKQVLATEHAATQAVEQTAVPVAAAATGTAEPQPQLAPIAAAPAVVDATPAVAVEAPPSLPEEIGGGQFDKKAAAAVPQERGQVVSCRHDPNYYYSFTFDNGQIWRQIDGRRFRRPRDCEFVAIITKDKFGYKMQVEGDEHKYRVKRIR